MISTFLILPRTDLNLSTEVKGRLGEAQGGREERAPLRRLGRERIWGAEACWTDACGMGSRKPVKAGNVLGTQGNQRVGSGACPVEGPDCAKHHLVYPQLFPCNQRQCVQEFLSYTSALICKSIETMLVKVNTALNDL